VTAYTLLAAACFGGLGLTLVMLIVAVRGVEPGTPRPSSGWSRRLQAGGRRVVVAVAVGVLTLLVTRWPVAAAAAAALTAAWPSLVGGTSGERAAVARLEALATWTESLRDTIAGAVGLEQAIPVTADAAHPLIRSQLLRLRGLLEARQPLPDALRRLAADLDDPSADLVVAALVLNAELRGPGLRQTLSALAASARDELDMRRRVEAGRRGIRRGVRIVVAVTVGFLAVLAVFNRDYLAPYDNPVGQLVLLGVVGVFTAGFAMLRHLAGVDMPDRFLSKVTAEGGLR
jgi:Flp pilus assembly protein TadB